jgi:hypothetical protein
MKYHLYPEEKVSQMALQWPSPSGRAILLELHLRLALQRHIQTSKPQTAVGKKRTKTNKRHRKS